MEFAAHDVSLGHLGTTRVSYAPKSILSEAIQVTPENIGKLSIEFESELFYREDGAPYFIFWAKRGTDEAPEPRRQLRIVPGVWIIPLWDDELHVYRDVEFRRTFLIEPELIVDPTLFETTLVKEEQKLEGQDVVKVEPAETTQIVPAFGSIAPSPVPRTDA